MPYFDGCRGRIHHDAWLPEGEVRSVVVFTHGYGEHLGLYDAFGRRLAADGHAVHAFDVVGHGRSEGRRAVVESWDHLVEDALTLARIATAQHPGVPLVFAGHSAGGLATYLIAARHPELMTAAVVSGGPLLPVDWVAAELAGDTDETENLEPPDLLSTHPDYVHALLNDPLVYQGGFTRETLLALEQSWQEVEASLERGGPDLPVLLVHGTEDRIAPLWIAERVSAGLPRATLRTFPGDLHDVLNEHDRDDVHDVVADWLAEVLATRAAA